MIHTLTGNLLAEHTLRFDDWTAGRTQRASTDAFQVGGKGINVARMLHRLDTPVTALCFAGGATGQECTDWLARQSWPFQAFATAAATRLGLVVRAPGRAETTFLGPDVAPDANAVAACMAFLQKQDPGDTLALCGSFPGWTSAACAPLRELVGDWAARGRLVADTYGPPLAELVQHPVSLIKINRHEFDGLFPESERRQTIAARLQAAGKRWPVRAWIVTDGPHAVWFKDAGLAPCSAEPPRVKEVSATGSGDVVFACVLHARSERGATLAEAVEFALPYGAANAASEGVADFPLNHSVKRGS
jgi:fructose-1-phosphate kinase PfkB-like protein